MPILPERVEITEVGLRDGLQIEGRILSTDEKLKLARALIAAGLRRLEATSFVSPARVPQLADADALIRALKAEVPEGVELRGLVPNARGAARALAAGVDTLVIVLSASDSHGQRNLNLTPEQSLAALPEILSMAGAAGTLVDASLSTAFGCPFEGDVPVARVLEIAKALRNAGCAAITFCDTTGMATPPQVLALAEVLRSDLPDLDAAFHFHDTRGLGLLGVWLAMGSGIRRFESSIGGLGGCPFAPNAAGNVCTEDLVHMLAESGVETGLDLAELVTASRLAQDLVGHELAGQIMKAGPRLGWPAP